MNRYAWFFIGNLDMRLMKLKILAKSTRYSYLIEGDDTALVVFINGKKYFIGLDDSGYDHGVKPVDYDAAVQVLCKAFAERLQYVVKGAMALIQFIPTVTPWGIMSKVPWYGVKSGDALTKVITSLIQGLRFESARRAFGVSLEQGFQWLNISGEFKIPKGMQIEDLLLERTITICQLIYSTDRPEFIHDSLIRTARNLYELESYSDDPQPVDISVVLGLIGLYGHEKFKDFVIYVSSKWDFRTPSKELSGLLKTYFKSQKNGSSPSGYERKAINAVLEIIYPKAGLRVTG
jgi:hypothetical protein